MSASREVEWKPPKQFDGYRVLWTISRTEQSSLCMGQDTVLDRPVTIRFLDLEERDSGLRERFLAEARSIARVQHPNVVTVHRVGAIDGRPYIISEYVRGQTIEQLPKPLPWRQVLPLAMAATRGLAAAHRRGVLHRSLRPNNIIVASDGTIKLTDFGLREFCGEEISQVRSLLDGPSQPADSQPELLLPHRAARSRADHPAAAVSHAHGADLLPGGIHRLLPDRGPVGADTAGVPDPHRRRPARGRVDADPLHTRRRSWSRPLNSYSPAAAPTRFPRAIPTEVCCPLKPSIGRCFLVAAVRSEHWSSACVRMLVCWWPPSLAWASRRCVEPVCCRWSRKVRSVVVVAGKC